MFVCVCVGMCVDYVNNYSVKHVLPRLTLDFVLSLGYGGGGADR